MTIAAMKVQAGVQRIPQVSNTIAVASGKGGVGKSTTSINLALALKAKGYQVGILDADIYGPNQPTMLGVCRRPEETADKKLLPIVSHGIPSMSMAYIIGPETPMIWRGPMVSKALQQLVFDTEWPALDFLILDLPPGTGDVQLTLCQKIPLTGAVVVTTPQEIACQDARKAVAMFAKLSIPVLGIIENMKTHICSQCGHQESIFGEGGAEAIAADNQIRYFAGIPLQKQIRDLADQGIPMVARYPECEVSKLYLNCAEQLVAGVQGLSRDYSDKFGVIKVE